VSSYSIAQHLVFAACERAVRPRPRLTVSEWADANRILSTEGSAEPGEWRTSRTPFLREIMDQLSEHSRAKKVVFKKSSQVGGTEVGSNWLGYIIAHAKGPVAIVMPTEKSLQDWMAQKFEPMAKDTPAVRDVLAARSNRNADNNASRKKFVGGILYAKTAGSTTELKSTSLRYAIADEVDEYDWSTLQGDPLGLLEVRLTTFHDRKLFIPSSPTLKDASRIDEEYEGGDQRRYLVPCPHCGHEQPLQWGNLRWTAPLGKQRHVTHAWYVCADRGHEIPEHHKAAMLDAGRWVAENDGAPYPSYHINALYSPAGLGLSWAELATEWIEAQLDPAKLMRFINTRLGESWADRSRDIKHSALTTRAEPVPRRTVPAGCLILTAGVDTQDDRLELQILGWGHDGKALRCWVIEYHVLPGRPSEPQVWDALAAYLATPLVNAWGRAMLPEATAIDSQGHHTQAVYAFVRARRVRRCIAIKGANVPGKPLLGKPRMQDVNWRGEVMKRGVALHEIGTDTAKATLYAWLNADGERAAPDRLVRFPEGLEEEYYAGLVAETFNPRKNRWEIKKGRRNEPLDTWVYGYAATNHPELFMHRWRAGDWKRLQRLIEPEDMTSAALKGLTAAANAAAQALTAAASPPPAPRAVGRKRGVFGKGGGWGTA
jgi:phage terminase large subunit GpA-like protein